MTPKQPAPTKHIYDQLRDAGCALDNHESDLYVKGSEASHRILKANHVAARGFVSQIDGALWYDVPFMFKPFWDRVAARAARASS